MLCWWSSWHEVRSEGHLPQLVSCLWRSSLGVRGYISSSPPWPVGGLEFCGSFFSASTSRGEHGDGGTFWLPPSCRICCGLHPRESSKAWRTVALRWQALTLSVCESSAHVGWMFPSPPRTADQSQGAAHPASHLNPGCQRQPLP